MNQYFETALLLKLRIALDVQFQWMPPTPQIKFRSQVNRHTDQKKNTFYLSNVKGCSFFFLEKNLQPYLIIISVLYEKIGRKCLVFVHKVSA
jgi:hypothetical protein